MLINVARGYLAGRVVPHRTQCFTAQQRFDWEQHLALQLLLTVPKLLATPLYGNGDGACILLVGQPTEVSAARTTVNALHG